MNFVKLKNKIVVDQYETEVLHTSYGVTIREQFHGIQYFETSTLNQLLLSVIPERYRGDFSILTMRINAKIPPHTDSGIVTSINAYIKPDNCITKFYKVKDIKNVRTKQLENQTNGRIFDLLSVDFVDEFKAEANDVYLLDVSKPHAVVSPTGIYNERIALCIQTFRHDFAAVTEMLRETGNL